MATNESVKFDKLKAGHAIALGIEDIAHMTEEQAHALAERLETYGVTKPEASRMALPGTGINPSAGSEIAEAPKGRVKRGAKNAPTIAQSVAPAAYDGDVMRVLEHFAGEGDSVGALGMQVYRGAMSRRVQAEMTQLVIDATASSGITGSADSFLDRFGY